MGVQRHGRTAAEGRGKTVYDVLLAAPTLWGSSPPPRRPKGVAACTRLRGPAKTR